MTKAALGATWILLLTSVSTAAPILQSTDFIIPIDRDPGTVPASNYPAGENPFFGIDNDPGTKYLNFAQRYSGLIVTPITGPSIVRSIQLTTANDATERDPAAWTLEGTNDPIQTLDNSNTAALETWTPIANSAVALPDTRLTAGPLQSFANATQYTSYRIVFPELKNAAAANSMQVGDIGLFTTTDASTPSIFSGLADDARAIRLPVPIPQSRSPAAEQVANLLDGATTTQFGNPPITVLTKYLNFGKENSGFIVTPGSGSSIVTSFQMTTAFDAPNRDPATWELYGTNAPITSTAHSQGDAEGAAWVLIDSGSLALPAARDTAGDVVAVDNTTAYTSYKMIFPTLKDAAVVDSMQLAGIQFFSSAPAADADFDNDGDVDGTDFLTWQRNVGTTGVNGGDADGDGSVDTDDLTIWKNTFGAAVAASSAVPEPASVALAALAAVGVAVAARKRRVE
jgi:hypothetical protein